jgi:hypothetical protein
MTAFTYVNVHRKENTTRNLFDIFRQEGNLSNFYDMMYNLFYFSQNVIYFIILSFYGQYVFRKPCVESCIPTLVVASLNVIK